MGDNNVGKTPPDYGHCQSCGAPLTEGAKFCRHCGMRVEPQQPVYDSVEAVEPPADPFDTPPARASEQKAEEPQNAHTDPFDAPPAENAGAGLKFCMRCGASLEEGAKFCRGCGTPVGDTGGVPVGSAYAAATPGEPAVPMSPAVKKKRTLGAVFYLVGAFISIILGFAFFCTPFMRVTLSVNYNGLQMAETHSQTGFGMIGVMFGARSDLVEAGVNATLLTWAGWLYFTFLIAIIYHAVCVGLNITRYKNGKRPYRVLDSSLTMALAGFFILIVGCIARAQVSDAAEISISQQVGSEYASMFDLSSYLGFVALFVLTVIGLGFCIAGFACSKSTFPPFDKKAKKTGAVLGIFITDIVCAVLIVLSLIAPVAGAFSANDDPEIEVKAGDSGEACLTCNRRYNGYYVGATVFKLDAASGRYRFRIETDDVSSSILPGSIVLVEYDVVEGKKADEIFESIQYNYIDTNSYDESGEGYAYLDFTLNSDTEYAIVVGFTATGTLSVNYDYSLRAK